MQSQLLLICLHLSENIPLFGIKKPVHEVESLVPGLDDHFLKQLFLVVDGFEERVLGRGRGYNATLLVLEGRDACPE